ncbi:hypothetical protein AQULUS_00280 [Aquicella lusitana]|uniref:Pyridoxal phosphate homeostasis protein n=2 Tax=Aquicella lusitana TaxID=254246 RepID=A0A370GBX5_9COXI|nr:hypothetical protein C8D86_12015 [Aquicella lusitana]VVC72318.1 hypothetical protein AQULUS_00280 [Aquicella lusitana]
MTMTIRTQLAAVKKRIADYAEKYGRKADSVHLLAVSKGQPIEKIEAAFQAGQPDFGENYLQEALSKIDRLAHKAITWHFIGPVQSNKTRKIAEHFAWVHSVDNKKIATRLNDQRPSHLPPLNICIEVNVSNESSKSGVRAEEVLPLARYCMGLPNIKLRGLMTIPAPQKDFAAQRQSFHALFLLWQRLREQGCELDTLSMGMSDDFEAAIAEGSTLVRIGTAIFGSRA